MGEYKTVYIVKTSWLDSCAKNAVACETYETAWRIANSIDSDHANLLIDELLVVAPVNEGVRGTVFMDGYGHKYELTDRTIVNEFGITLHRIRALKDFGGIKAGDLGGWIESEDNLTQDGDAWVSSNAMVYGNARVSEKALVYGSAQISGNANICGYAKVCDAAQVSGDAWVHGHAQVSGVAHIYGSARVYGSANICDNARIYGMAMIRDNAWIYDEAQVYGCAQVYGNAWIYDEAQVYDDALVFDSARVCCATKIFGIAKVNGNACVITDTAINKPSDLLTIAPIGDRNGSMTFYASKDNITVVYDDFIGPIEKFLAWVDETHDEAKHAKTYRLAAELAMEQIGERSDEPA